MQASPAKYNLALPPLPSTTRRAHAACGAVYEAGEAVVRPGSAAFKDCD